MRRSDHLANDLARTLRTLGDYRTWIELLERGCIVGASTRSGQPFTVWHEFRDGDQHDEGLVAYVARELHWQLRTAGQA